MFARLFSIPAVALAASAAILCAADSHSTNSPLTLDLKKLQLAPGLKLELVASEPLLQNPVCFSIDGHGRFFVVETHRYRNAIFDITANTPWLLDDLSFRTVNDRAAFLARTFATNFALLTNDSEVIRLVEDRDGDGRAETSSVFAEGFREPVSGTAAGVLAQGTNIWFTCIPDLWRIPTSVAADVRRLTSISSTNRDQSLVTSAATRRERLATGLGVHISVSGHDVHGLIRGHDGRIYFSFGDRGVCVTNREGVVLNVPDTGGVLRCEPDGHNLEIFCTGLRNPQELAFDDYGNLWTVDNDTAGADPCRVLHLVEGGDYGWRMSYQHMKGFGPWVQEELWRGGLDGILPPVGTVSQGPAGLAFYPGTSATPQLAGKFVHADFPGGIWAYSVKPRGASYEIADKEKILWNCWPTDVDFGPDGALYVLDWVQGWTSPGKGRIYRLTSTNAINAPEIAEVQSLLRDGMTKRGEKELQALLDHKDRRVRLEAQWKLAERGTNSVDGLLKIALSGKQVRPRLHALWGLGMVWRDYPPPRNQRFGDSTFDQMAACLPLLEDRDERIRAGAANLLSELLFLNLDIPTKKQLRDSSLLVRCNAVLAQARLVSGFGGVDRVRERLSRYELMTDAFRWFIQKQTRGSQMMMPISEFKKLGDDPLANDPLLILALTRFYEADVSRYVKRNSPAGVVFTNTFLNLGTNFANRFAALLACKRIEYDGITNFASDSNPRLVLEAARSINDAPIPNAYPALAAMLEDSRFLDANWGWSALSNITPAGPFSAKVRPPRDQVLLRALNAHFRLGTATNAGALVRFALGGAPVSDPARTDSLGKRAGSKTGAPSHLRGEALFLLGAWEVLPAKVGDLPIKPAKDPNHGSVPTVNPENWPGWFDRVVGLWRPLPSRPADDARRALAPHIAALLSDDLSEVAQAALAAAVKLRLTNAVPTLMARLRNPATPSFLRRQIPPTLATMAAAELGDAVKVALADPDLEVRAAALPHLDRLQGDDAVRILGDIVAAEIGAPVSDPARSDNQEASRRAGGRRSEDTARLAQAALAALGNTQSSGATVILRFALTNLLAGTFPSVLELDLLDAATLRNDAEIKSLLARREAALPKDDPLATWRPVLSGGDAERGRKLFFEKVEVQCSRCHAIKDEGGTVGPALDGIARQRSREYLLESIVFPNRAIAPSFENVFITLKNGAEHAGLVKAEDEKELRLESPEEGPLRIARSDIVSRQRGLSAMPEGMDQLLTRREVRDLVEFMAGLR